MLSPGMLYASSILVYTLFFYFLFRIISISSCDLGKGLRNKHAYNGSHPMCCLTFALPVMWIGL